MLEGWQEDMGHKVQTHDTHNRRQRPLQNRQLDQHNTHGIQTGQQNQQKKPKTMFLIISYPQCSASTRHAKHDAETETKTKQSNTKT